MPGQDAESRKRGRIEKRGNSLRVRVYAGDDPVTGRRVYRNETVRGTDKAAEKRAQKVLTRLLAEVDAQRAPTSTVAPTNSTSTPTVDRARASDQRVQRGRRLTEIALVTRQSPSVTPHRPNRNGGARR
jgi:hypothetical protein